MEKDNLKKLLQDLKVVVSELESEIYADVESYEPFTLSIEMDSMLEYEHINDDDEEGL